MIMTYKCPYTDVCRAETLRDFARFPELALVVQQRLQCSERDPGRAKRCATRLGLTELELPTFGGYIQERRRSQQIPQRQLAQQVGVDLQVLRDVELEKTDPTKLPVSVIERIATALSESAAYLVALTHIPNHSNVQRLGVAFTRITSTDDEELS